MENILAWLVIGGLISIPILNTVAATITWYAKKKSGKQIDIIPYPVVDYSEKTWLELEQAYAEYIKIGWYGGLRGVEWARFNILYKEKRYRQAVEHALEAMYLEINGSDASYDYQFDNVKKNNMLLGQRMGKYKRCCILPIWQRRTSHSTSKDHRARVGRYVY